MSQATIRNKKTASMPHRMFFGNASSVSYMNIPSLFVCREVRVSMRSRVLACLCVRAFRVCMSEPRAHVFK